MKRFFVVLCLLCPMCLFGVSTSFFSNPLSGGLTGNGQPAVAVSGSGNAMAIWQINNSNQIFSSFLLSGGGFLTQQIPFGIGFAPQVGVDQSGNAIVVWVSGDPNTRGNILASYFNTSTMQWLSIPVVLAGGSTNNAPQISMNSSGLALVVWNQTTPFQVLARSVMFNGSTLGATATTFFIGTVPASFGIGNTTSAGTATGFAVWNDNTTKVNAASILVP